MNTRTGPIARYVRMVLAAQPLSAECHLRPVDVALVGAMCGLAYSTESRSVDWCSEDELISRALESERRDAEIMRRQMAGWSVNYRWGVPPHAGVLLFGPADQHSNSAAIA